MTGVVLDASAALAWVLPESKKQRESVLTLFDRIRAGELRADVPYLFFNEVAAGLTRAVRGNRLAKAHAEEFVQQLNSVPVNLSIEILTIGQWMERAARLHCQVADGAYLALDKELKQALATVDGGLATAATSNKVALYQL